MWQAVYFNSDRFLSNIKTGMVDAQQFKNKYEYLTKFITSQ